MKMKALVKFVALVAALFVVLFLVAQLIHAVDPRSHQTHWSTDLPQHTSSISSSARAHGSPVSSSTGAHSAAASGNSALFVAAAPPPHLDSSTALAASHSATDDHDSAASVFSTLAVDDSSSLADDNARADDLLAAKSSEAAPEREERQEEEALTEVETHDQTAVADERMTYSTFTPVSAPSRPLCRALAGKVSSTIEYGAEDSDEGSKQQRAEQDDLRLLLTLEHVEAMVDQVDIHVKINADDTGRCYNFASSTHSHSYSHTAHADFDSADERHGLTRAELTYRMVQHQHATRRGEQHWEKLINFLARTSPHCAEVAFTLHHRALACNSLYQPLQLPTALPVSEGRREATAGWKTSEDDMQQASHDIVTLLGSLASLVSSAAIGLVPAPTTTLPAQLPGSTTLSSTAVTPASPCSNISFTSTARLVNLTRLHVLYTPHYHHPQIRKIDVILRNVTGPILSWRPYRMSRVPQTHMSVYRAVVWMGVAATGREVSFDYLFRVALKGRHVCTVRGGHFSSNSSRSSAPQPSQSSTHPPTATERCPITDVFNVSAKLIRSSAVQASSESPLHTYKLVLTSHALQLDWVHVHLFVNASQPTAITEGHYRMTRALTPPADTQQSVSSGARWEHVLGSGTNATAEVEYAFTYHFNSTTCDTKARVSTLERLLLGEERVEPSEQVQSLFHVLGQEENEQLRDEQGSTVDQLMDATQQEDGLKVVKVEPAASSEDQLAEATPVVEQMDTLAAGVETITASQGARLQPPQAVSVSIDALGRVVPASVPFDVTQRGGIGPVIPPPYHQYQQPQSTMFSSAHAASATAFAPESFPHAVHSAAAQQAATSVGGMLEEQMQVLDARGCTSGDYMCQITSMCRPCMDRSHADFCAPCAHLFSCASEECARAAVRLLSHM